MNTKIRNCHTCGRFMTLVGDYPATDVQAYREYHCNWCGGHYKKYPSVGSGWHEYPARCHGRDFPYEVVCQCGRIAKVVREEVKAVMYTCRDYGCAYEGWLSLWQNPSRTLSAQDIYWSQRYDCPRAGVTHPATTRQARLTLTLD